MPKIDESKPFIPVRIAVLTVSDTRTVKEDKSGTLLAAMLTDAGHQLAEHVIVKDEIPQIREVLNRWIADKSVDAVITTGGTGLTGRDVTPEAVMPMFDKVIEGFSVLMHMLSYEKVGTSTIQSRSVAGVAGGTYIFCVPGSPGACRDAWEGILKYQFDARHRPCNFVEIMPRLTEHLEAAAAK